MAQSDTKAKHWRRSIESSVRVPFGARCSIWRAKALHGTGFRGEMEMTSIRHGLPTGPGRELLGGLRSQMISDIVLCVGGWQRSDLLGETWHVFSSQTLA